MLAMNSVIRFRSLMEVLMLVARATDARKGGFALVDRGDQRSVCGELLKTERTAEVEGDLLVGWSVSMIEVAKIGVGLTSSSRGAIGPLNDLRIEEQVPSEDMSIMSW